MDRSTLPYRRNCEGYFFTNDGKVLAKDTKKGYLVFPGGGIDKGEHADSAVVRETFEETGAIIQLPIKDLETVQFIWDENWARSEKQKRRYKEYKGEEMHFFSGKIKEFTKNEEQHEDYWEGEKLMPISKAIKIIEKEKPFPENMKVYREAQLKFLNQINNT
ncbi:NUDIX hydrolase [Candidatus Woesearchaeota archaeon]|jgi:8-oxo-dGTP pyrophosphatase MutT (NUDIX family)|nr:NUDIX hydrolase [Candidatus Woesearchaeota archaeon]MBT4336413.1 NUDIX hydrolase [Candidatus Woesearchaeota archaeon]MBT4469932.1 NUDIX hydrolase [Candidatus Woesearchaeota archaeon]MBT6744344.1 NUDIX hydrolase [Candidatus Woesearchaeota archaeon]